MAILKHILRLLPALLVLPLLTSCMQDFNPDIYQDPVVCINSRIVAGEPVVVRVTRTWRWNEGNPGDELDINLKDADVVLYVNDEPLEHLRYEVREIDDFASWWYGRGEYGVFVTDSDYRPAPGDRIRITADDKTYGFAEGSVEVPQPVDIEDVKAYPSGISESVDGNTAICTGESTLELFFTDPADRRDFYEFDYHYRYGPDTSEHKYFYAQVNPSVEPLFSEHMSAIESIDADVSGYYFFSDRQISGKRYPLHVRVEGIYYPYDAAQGVGSNPSAIEFVLYSISESMYRHVISVWQGNDGTLGALSGIGLADHVWESSNVSTRAGVVCAVTPTRFAVPVSRLLGLR